MVLSAQRQLFSLPRDVAYFNGAYMSPQLIAVEEAGLEALRRKNQPHLITGSDFFTEVQQLKQAFAQLVNVSEPDRIALIPSVSYGLAQVARNMPVRPGSELLVAAGQFPSNYYPWQRLADEQGAHVRVVPAPPPHESWTQQILAHITNQTALVAIGHLHWADGRPYDLIAIGEKVKQVGAWLVIDGTQSVGALPFDVQLLQPDALICGGYKWLMGPYGLGVAYFGPALDGGQPIEDNWINRLHSEEFAGLTNYQSAYRPMAARYSVGEQSNFILVPMLLQGIRQLLDWQPERIQAYCANLLARPLERLQELGLQLAEHHHRAHHLIGLHLPPVATASVLKAKLQEERVYVSFRGSAMRLSCHLYNDAEDADRLVQVFRKTLA